MKVPMLSSLGHASFKSPLPFRASWPKKSLPRNYRYGMSRAIRTCYIGVNSVLAHDANQDEDELEHQDEHHGQLEKLPPGHRRLLNRETVNVVQGLEFRLDVRLPFIEAETIGDQAEQSGRVNVADELEGVLGAVRQFVDV